MNLTVIQKEILRWLAGLRGESTTGVVRVGIDNACWFKHIDKGRVCGGWSLNGYDVGLLVGLGYIALESDPEIRTGTLTEAGEAYIKEQPE